MSDYLIRRITDTSNITLHANTEITSLQRDDHVERVIWRDVHGRALESHAIGHVFLMTGAIPSTRWLHGCIAFDDKRFVQAGPDIATESTAHYCGFLLLTHFLPFSGVAL